MYLTNSLIRTPLSFVKQPGRTASKKEKLVSQKTENVHVHDISDLLYMLASFSYSILEKESTTASNFV